MKIIEFFTAENKEHWLQEIAKCDWGAGEYLHDLMRENKLQETVGENTLVPMLVDEAEDKLAAFCTFAPLDDIQPTELSPWIGFLYTFPEYRGHHYAGLLLDYAESIATIMGRENIYISTGHTGLYEKYGYEFFKIAKDIHGEDSRIYKKNLSEEGEEKTRRMEQGGIWKAQIVEAARKDIDTIAYCGFSCNHCFLGQWCGGCRSVFNCCSYGTLYDKGLCPNKKCSLEKGIEGCYACDELEHCNKGFYHKGNNGAAACKAQALFIQKHGTDKYIKALDTLHTLYDSESAQKVLDRDVQEGLAILEKFI